MDKAGSANAVLAPYRVLDLADEKALMCGNLPPPHSLVAFSPYPFPQ